MLIPCRLDKRCLVSYCFLAVLIQSSSRPSAYAAKAVSNVSTPWRATTPRPLRFKVTRAARGPRPTRVTSSVVIMSPTVLVIKLKCVQLNILSNL